MLGLAASMRASTTYAYAAESLWVRADKVQYSACMFAGDGLVTTITAFLFWSRLLTWRSYCAASCILTLSAIGFIWLRLPESPAFLYERCKFDRLKASLSRIAMLNGCYSKEHMDYTMKKLQSQRDQELQVILDSSYQTNEEVINKGFCLSFY